MKTVIRWKNAGKAAVMVLLAGVAVSLLQLPEPFSFLLGMLAGEVCAAAMFFSMARWDIFDFE